MRQIAVLFMLFCSFAFAQMGAQGMGQGPKAGQGMGGMQMFQSVPQNEAELIQKGASKEYCPNCGMHLPKFYKTNHAVKLKNGETRQFCSIHCLAEEREMGYLRDKRNEITEVLVVDVASKKFIDAKKAHYVVGSRVKGTMTGTSKYAFAKKSDAEAFIKKNGGTLTSHDGAYKAALDDFERDMMMIKKNRGNMMYKMGEELFNNRCDQAAFKNFHAHTMGISKLKSVIRALAEPACPTRNFRELCFTTGI